MQSATIRSIATATRLSPGTVSRCLSGHPDIHPQTRARVVATARAMNYQAPSTRGRSAHSRLNLGVLIGHHCGTQADPNIPVSGPDPSFVGYHFLESLSRQALEQAIQMQVSFIDPHATETLCSPSMRSWFDGNAFDALVLIYPFPHDAVAQQAERLPVISLEHAYPGLPVDVFGPTHAMDVMLATEHLIRLGHRRIGYIGDEIPTHRLTQGLRFGGYLSALQQAGLPVCPPDIFNVLEQWVSKTDLPDLIEQRSREGVTAWVCSIDRHAHLLWRELPRRGLEIPRDLSLTGIGGVGATDLPALTTWRLPYEALTQAALERLRYRLDHPRAPRIYVELTSHPISGQSTAPPATHR